MTSQRKVIINKIKRKTDWRYSTYEIEKMFKACGKDTHDTIEVLKLATWRTEFFKQQQAKKGEKHDDT